MSSELAGGRYVITNVRFRNIAFLADPNDGTPVTADVEQNRNGEKVRNRLTPANVFLSGIFCSGM